MKPITLYTANCRGDRFNTTYPVRRVITSDDDLRDAAQYDQVFAEYKNSHTLTGQPNSIKRKSIW